MGAILQYNALGLPPAIDVRVGPLGQGRSQTAGREEK
jgi:hypothetical protein